MNREPTTQTLTVLVVGDERSPMRRFQIPREKAKRFVVLAAGAAFLLALALVDWVRLRVEAVDVDQLSAETSAQRELVESVAGSLEELEGELERLREFERKVRVIADLPESTTVAVGGPDESGPQGGAGEVPTEAQDGLDGPLRAPSAHLSLPLELLPDSRMPQNHVHPAALARVTRKASRLVPQTSAQLSALEDLVGQLQGKSARLAATPSIWPTEGWLTSRYGYRVSPFTGRRQFHAGIDVAANPGTEVVAPAEGKVVSVGKRGALGQSLVIDHGHGMRTTYGHLQKVFVGPGEGVDRGQLIAAVGNTGRSTGPHLHYAVEVNGKARDPMNYILE